MGKSGFLFCALQLSSAIEWKGELGLDYYQMIRIYQITYAALESCTKQCCKLPHGKSIKAVFSTAYLSIISPGRSEYVVGAGSMDNNSSSELFVAVC